MQIIRTKDMVELDDDLIRRIVVSYVENQLSRNVDEITFYQTNNADARGNRMHAKVQLAFEDKP